MPLGTCKAANVAFQALTSTSAVAVPSWSPLQLPALAWHTVTLQLDHFSRRQLKITNKFFYSLITSAMAQLSFSGCDLKGLDETLAAEARTVSCLCITAPRRPIALSGMNHRRRCEQHLAVFLDNMNPWPTLTALDISTALSHISCATLQLLVESLPHLQQLSLPPVATCGGTEVDALCALQQLPDLCACDLDCSLFSQSPTSSLQEEEQDPQAPQQKLRNVDGGSQQLPMQMQHYPALQQMALNQAGPSLMGKLQDEQQQPALELPAQQCMNTTQQRVGPHPNCNPADVACDNQLQKLAARLAEHAHSSSSSSSSHSGMSITNDSSSRLQTSTTSTPACSSTQHSSGSNGSGLGGSCSCGGPAAVSGRLSRPWLGLCVLTHMQHLQLQHLQPSCVRDAVSALSRMKGLATLSITELSPCSASLLLMPIASTGSEASSEAERVHGPGQWLLDPLQDLTHLTRFELGLNSCSTSHGSCGSTSSQAACLFVPGHTGSSVAHAAGAAGGLECAWSSLRQVQELSLLGICLDSTVLAATLQCSCLTALRVGGLDLQQDVSTLAGLMAPGLSSGLPSLQLLQVDQHFSMGPNQASLLMPALRSLKLVHGGNCSPDLACLEHHQHLSQLYITTPTGSRWCLHSLQLGHLVHLQSLQELRLAESTSSDDSSGSSTDASSSRTGGSRRPIAGFRAASPCSKNSSSHWLPACTGSLAQVTSLELAGAVPDHTLGQLPTQFPGLKRLTVDSSYFASDGGLQKLHCAPHLQLLVLRHCRHITDYGLEVLMMAGGLQVVAVQGCAGIDERACQRIRKACRHSGTQLLWYGADVSSTGGSSCRSGTAASSPWRSNTGSHGQSCASTSISTSPSQASPCRGASCASSSGCQPSGSAFLHRCWKQAQQQQQPRAGQDQYAGQTGPASALVAAATAAWLDCCSQEATAASSNTGSNSWGRSQRGQGPGSSRSRIATSGCVPTTGLHSHGRVAPWSRNVWDNGGHASNAPLAH